MKLPHSLLNSPFFVFSSKAEFLRAIAGEVDDQENHLVHRLCEGGLPPITSRSTLATMLGVSPGLVWSFETRPGRHYREFSIPKGAGERRIQAPKVALKIVQKWLSVQFEKIYTPPPHVYGFVKGRTHIMAAMQHTAAKWVLSLDIENFFQSTPRDSISGRLEGLGYENEGARLIASICCHGRFLAQGAPSSPIFSNLVFNDLDSSLSALANKYAVRLTRYADDIVFSGVSDFPSTLMDEVAGLFEEAPWKLSGHKTELSIAPKARLKVHGLLVHGDHARLTKGYRNRLRGFRHVLSADKVRQEDLNRLKGHVNYAAMVEKTIRGETDKAV